MSLRGLPSHLPTPLPRLRVGTRYPNSSRGVCRPGDLKTIINLSAPGNLYPSPAKIPSQLFGFSNRLLSFFRKATVGRERESARIPASITC